MKKLILAFSLLGSTVALAQNNSRSGDAKKADADSLYLNFVGQLVSVNGNSAAPSATLELSDQPNLKLNLPLFQGYKQDHPSSSAVYIDAKIGASNGYSPLIGKGNWKPTAEANVSYLLFAPKIVRFYSSEVGNADYTKNASGAQLLLDEYPITEASSINYGWFSAKAGISHAEYYVYVDAVDASFGDRLRDTINTSGNLRFSYSHYYFPSKNKLPFLSLLGSLYAEYKSNDNNYNTLTKVDVERRRTFDGPNDSSIVVTDAKISAGKGAYLRGSSYNLGGELMLLISPKDSKFTLGLSGGAFRKMFNEQSYTTAIFTINIPVMSKTAYGKETAVNLAFKAELPDIHGEHNPKDKLGERTRVGFIVGLPLPNHRR